MADGSWQLANYLGTLYLLGYDNAFTFEQVRPCFSVSKLRDTGVAAALVRRKAPFVL